MDPHSSNSFFQGPTIVQKSSANHVDYTLPVLQLLPLFFTAILPLSDLVTTC